MVAPAKVRFSTGAAPTRGILIASLDIVVRNEEAEGLGEIPELVK